MATCFLVMGTPRSGTSAVAGILHHLGIPMGERIDDPNNPDRWDFSDPNEWNPRGHFQDAAFGNLEDVEFGPHLPPSKDWVPSERFRTTLRTLIEARCLSGYWGLKSNRLPFYIDLFTSLWGQEIKTIVTKREKARSLVSWHARGGAEEGKVLIDTNFTPPNNSLIIEFDSLFDATEETVSRIAAFVGRPLTEKALFHVIPELRRF